MKCNVCRHTLETVLYQSHGTQSLSSLSKLHPGNTSVYFCHQCGHLQTPEIENIARFYDHDYNILVESEEEDQLYEVVNGETIYRTEHQVRTLRSKVSFPPHAKILDYGCAKSSTMHTLVTQGTAQGTPLAPYLFDVSDRYLPFWEKFLAPEHWATYHLPPAWDGQFDLVTSFFSLEHVAKPEASLQDIRRILKVGGRLYGVVPNVFTNTADLIVVDHVNHFTRTSLSFLLQNNGFEVIEIDDTAHRGAWVFLAQKQAVAVSTQAHIDTLAVQKIFAEAQKIAKFWQHAAEKIQAFENTFERTQPTNKKLAIYGAAFYGAFITSCLTHPDRIAWIVDHNPFLQGKHLNGLPVVSPNDLPKEIDTLLVGLNPAHAKKTIAEIEAFKSRPLTYFFL